MKSAKILGSALAFSLISMASLEAHADYVCRALYIPGNTALGVQGYVYTTLYAAPNCGGAFVASRYFCTGGATSGVCASGTLFTYERSGLLELYAGLRYAASVDQLVSAPANPCIGGGGVSCGGHVYFDAN